MQEVKDWLYIGGFIAAAVAIFWKTILGGDKDVKEWAEKRFVPRELFDVHLLQIKEELKAGREQREKQHEEGKNLQIAILDAVGGKLPPTMPRRERPTNPGNR